MFGGLVSGIVFGSIVTLGSLGLSYVLLLQNYFNFTAGSYVSLGAYFALAFMGFLPSMGEFPIVTFGPEWIIAGLLAMVALGLVMTLVDKTLFRPLRERNAPFMFFYLTAFGMVFVVRSIIRLVWGPQMKFYYSGSAEGLHFWGATIGADEIFVVLITLVAVGVLYYFQYHTKLGRGMLAMASNESLAEISGIRSRDIHTLVTIIAGVLSAFGGILYGLTVQLRPLMGFNILLAMFVAVVCGGEGAILGTLGAGLVVGISQEFGSKVFQLLFDSIGVPIEMTAYKAVITFVLMVIVMWFKPNGIFENTFLEK